MIEGACTVVYESTIPNDQIATHMDIVCVGAWMADMDVLSYCENLLVRSYPAEFLEGRGRGR